MSNNSQVNHHQQHENGVQRQTELVRLIKEQGYLDPLCATCPTDSFEVSGKDLQNLNQRLISLTKQVEEQEEKIHLDMLHVDTIKSKLGNVAKGFVFIANKYSKIGQQIMNFEKSVSYYCDLQNNYIPQIQRMIESLHKDKSEQNYKHIVKEYDLISANLVNNNAFLVDEEESAKRKKYIAEVEEYSDKLKEQLEVCSFIADTIFSTLDYQSFSTQFKELLRLKDRPKIKTLNLTLEDQLEQVRDQLYECQLQKTSMEKLYLNVKQYLQQSNIIIPETVLQVDLLSSPQKSRTSPPRKYVSSSPGSKRESEIIENSKDIIQKLMGNNKQLNELAKRVIDENKSLKKENEKYLEKINGISPIVNLATTHTPSLNTIKNLRNSMTTQVSEFNQVSSFSPNPKALRSPPSSKQQRVVFESIKNSYSKSPLKKSYALENTVQSIDIECSQTLQMMKVKDGELTDLNQQRDQLSCEISDLKSKIEKQQEEIKELEESLNVQKLSYEKQIFSLKNSIISHQQDIQIYQNKCNILSQEKQKLSLENQKMLETIQNLSKENKLTASIIQSENLLGQSRGNILSDHNLNQRFEQQKSGYSQNDLQNSKLQRNSEDSADDSHFQIINLKKKNLSQQDTSPQANFAQQDQLNNSKIKINTMIDHKSKMQKKVSSSSNKIENNNNKSDSYKKSTNQLIKPQIILMSDFYDGNNYYNSDGDHKQSVIEQEKSAQKSQSDQKQLDRMSKRNFDEIVIQDEQFLVINDPNHQL